MPQVATNPEEKPNVDLVVVRENTECLVSVRELTRWARFLTIVISFSTSSKSRLPTPKMGVEPAPLASSRSGHPAGSGRWRSTLRLAGHARCVPLHVSHSPSTDAYATASHHNP